MSLFDQLKDLEEQVTRRVRELRPLVAEFDELKQVAARLGISERLGLTEPVAGQEAAGAGTTAATAQTSSSARPAKRGGASASRARDAGAGKRAASGSGGGKRAGTRQRPQAKDRAETRSRVGSGGQEQQHATASGGAPDPAAKRAANPAARGTAAGAGKAAKGRGASGRVAGVNREGEILSAVRENPGMTVAELGARLGVAPTNLYRPIKRLSDRGELRKNGAKLESTAGGSAPAATS